MKIQKPENAIFLVFQNCQLDITWTLEHQVEDALGGGNDSQELADYIYAELRAKSNT